MDGRQERGRALAQDPRIKQVDGAIWFVPSTKAGGYLVNAEAGTCTCPDYTGQRVKCKHLIAVAIVRDELAKGGAQTSLAFPSPKAPAKPAKRSRGDLTADEQGRVLAALRFLRVQCGGWETIAEGTALSVTYLQKVAYGRPPGARLAMRLARFAGVPVDDILTGCFPPPGTCPHCGHRVTPSG